MNKVTRISLGIAALLALMGISAAYWSYQSFLAASQHIAKPIELEIKAGTTAYGLLGRLAERQVIDNPWLAKWYLRFNPEKQAIQAGWYQFSGHLRIDQVFDKLVAGEQQLFTLTLVEGLTIKQALSAIRKHPHLVDDLQPNGTLKLVELISSDYASAEGLFFADTYSFYHGYRLSELLKSAKQKMDQVLEEEWQARSLILPYNSQYEALVMASIIEKETAVAEERPRIAGVFVRRLQKKMRLQTDPTVIYGLGDAFDGDLKRIHLRTDTPYNTYTRKGLPPTPIALVGREAVHAALNPTDDTALYFVAKGDGSHQFSDTLEQHLAAVKKYQLKQP